MKKKPSNEVTHKGLKSIAYLFLGLLLFNSCTKEEELPPLIIPTRASFSSPSFIIAKDFTQATPITLTLARTLEKPGTITIQQVAASTTAASTEYTTSSAFSNGTLTIDLPQGSTTASFTVTSLHNFDDNKTIVFKIISGTGGAVLGDANLTTTVTMRGNKWVDPAISTSLATLDNFGNVNVGTKSASKSYTLSGLNLSAPVAVVASENFKVSLNNTTFNSSVSIDVNNKSATIYVKFAPVTAKNQNLTGTITHSFTGLANLVVTVSGAEVGNIPYVPETPLLAENFEYGTATDFLARLTTNWAAYSAAGAIPVIYVPNGLSFTRYAGSGVGGSATIDHGDFSREDIARPFASQTTGTVYTAVMVNLSKAGVGDFFYAMRDAAGGFFNRLYAKDDGSGNLILGFAKNTAAIYSTVNYKYNTTYLVITKYDFATKISSLFVLDGTFPDAEPPTPTAVSLATGTAPANLADIAIRQSDGDLSGSLDGIRVATTWKGALGL